MLGIPALVVHTAGHHQLDHDVLGTPAPHDGENHSVPGDGVAGRANESLSRDVVDGNGRAGHEDGCLCHARSWAAVHHIPEGGHVHTALCGHTVDYHDLAIADLEVPGDLQTTGHAVDHTRADGHNVEHHQCDGWIHSKTGVFDCDCLCETMIRVHLTPQCHRSEGALSGTLATARHCKHHDDIGHNSKRCRLRRKLVNVT